MAILFDRNKRLAHGVRQEAIVTGLLVAGLTLLELVRKSYPTEFDKYPFVFYAIALAVVFTFIFVSSLIVARRFDNRLDDFEKGLEAVIVF